MMKSTTITKPEETDFFKYDVGDFVILKIGNSRFVNCQILERAKKEKNKPYYRVDWTLSGHQQILNSVFVCEAALKEIDNGI